MKRTNATYFISLYNYSGLLIKPLKSSWLYAGVG